MKVAGDRERQREKKKPERRIDREKRKGEREIRKDREKELVSKSLLLVQN